MAPSPTTSEAGAGAGARLLDLRGLRCPWPALRVARALREEAAPLLAVADDPAAEKEIAAIVAERGWRLDYAESLIGQGFLILPITVE
jgi:tRNA 2-thiouridine synthesizing protein A